MSNISIIFWAFSEKIRISACGIFYIDIFSFQEFYADHPFIYFVREKTTGSILFMGRYVAPPGEGGELPKVGELNYQVTNANYVIIRTISAVHNAFEHQSSVRQILVELDQHNL